jgi:8-oxo-dGTP diphosphatase
MINVTAGILIKDAEVLIAKRKTAARLAGKWEFPGGKIERDETPEACLHRELEEELGIDATVGDYMGESIYPYDFGTVRILFYRVFWNGEPIVSREHQEVQWVPFNELNRYDFVPADLAFVEKIQSGTIFSN